MKTIYTLFILFLIFLNFHGSAQQKDKPNYLYTRITIPIWVDFIEKTDNTNPKYKDYEKTWTNNVLDIYIDLPNIPIDAGVMHFNGKYTYDLMPFSTYDISGKVSEDRRMLQELTVKMNTAYNNRGYEETAKWTVIITDMPLTNGIGHWSKEKTKVIVKGYEYKTVTTSSSRVEYQDYVFKSVNEDKILEYPVGYSFRIDLNIDGPPSYTISVTDVRGPNLSWEPPAAVANPEYFVKDIEPHSLRFYQDIAELDELSINYTKRIIDNLLLDLENRPGLKVLGSTMITKIINEIDLSQSGLVKEDSRVNKGKLMKEGISVISRVDMPAKEESIRIQSRKGEKIVSIKNLTDQNWSFAFNAARIEVLQIINNYLSE